MTCGMFLFSILPASHGDMSLAVEIEKTEVPVPSSLGASDSRSDPEVSAPLFSVLSPTQVAYTLGSHPQRSHPHQTVKLSETPAHSSSTMDTTAGLGPLMESLQYNIAD